MSDNDSRTPTAGTPVPLSRTEAGEPRPDFGDLSHLFAIPYCTVAIMERDLANVLQQIQRHDGVLHSTSVWNIDFFTTWPAPMAG